ncbi:uncharacterized protein LOC142230425 [Haematobia irritans]|uniref:uncharacterized protein LOC142230425 n=1 Tax=Haematobia irritans TaxID=7368 RepID=UPI003F4FB263
MRKRELQSIPLKLAELKEYDAVKTERILNKSKNSSGEASGAPKEASPIANVGPKTKKEIQERINTTM